MIPNTTSPRPREPVVLAPRLLLTLAALLLAAGTATAQLGFTEFAVTDTALNSSDSTDFWIASAAPADADADGDLDLLIAGYYVGYATESNPDGWFEDRLTLYRNDGPAGVAWALTPITIDAAGLSFTWADLAWGDYDGDGDPDLAVGAATRVALYRNDAGSLVPTPTLFPDYYEDSDFLSMDQRSITWADFDNDGDLDLLLPSLAEEFDRLPTRLLRNDGAGDAGAWTFTDVGASLPIAANAVSAWADMEGDGDLDLLLGNVSPYGDNFLGTYRNDAGVLTPVATDLALIRYGTADWGDADNDGDLDIVYGGNMDLPDGSGGETVVRILVNDGAGGYTPTDVAEAFGGPEMAWLDFAAVTWADYDSDGDVDLLVSGEWLAPGEIEGRALVYVNDGGTFTASSEPLPAPVVGNAGGAFTWFDVDSDGDLDYFVAGGYYVPGGNGLIEARTQLFRNDALAANAPPTAPSGLAAGVNGDDVVLGWNASSDDHTPAAVLTYDLELIAPASLAQFAPGAQGAVARALPQPGNVGANHQWRVNGLAPGTYGWRVRALDNAFNAGPIAEGTFVIGGVTDVTSDPVRGVALSAAWPNPFDRETRFTLTLERAGRATVALHDVRGRRIAVIHDGPLAAGMHSLRIGSERLPSGSYFLRATARGHTVVRRVTLLN
jgi:hypothetical protein